MFSVDSKADPAQSGAKRTATLGSPSPRPEPSQPRPGATTTAANGISVIGRDLTILGEKIAIVSQNKLQVDGDVRGDVHGKQVVITAGGSVVGLVRAESIDVHGGVRGAIRAVTVTLHASAQVEGDIMHKNLGIAEGAQFEGRVRRSNDVDELMPVLDPEVIASGRYGSDGGFA